VFRTPVRKLFGNTLKPAPAGRASLLVMVGEGAQAMPGFLGRGLVLAQQIVGQIGQGPQVQAIGAVQVIRRALGNRQPDDAKQR
jgi:hypothetical protein